MSSVAFSKRSGGIEGLPVAAYISSNTGDSVLSTSSASCLIARIGCSDGTRASGEIRHSIDDCFVSLPRMPPSYALRSRCRSQATRSGRDRRAVDVIAPVIVAALVSGNEAVGVIGSVDDQGSIKRVSMATMRSKRSIPCAYSSASMRSSTCITSRCAADSMADPRAIV